MKFDESILKNNEKAIFTLRQLYRQNNYTPYKMSKFEEYDLYSENKDFLVSDGVITFNDTNGKLLALKPDVTLSILKNFKDTPGYVQKVYYDENVYRISESSHTYKEILQTGLECIGDITDLDVCQVSELAIKSLSLINNDFMFDLSHVGILESLLNKYNVDEKEKKHIIEAICHKNQNELKSVCNKEQYYAFSKLITNYSSADEAIRDLKSILPCDTGLEELCKIYNMAVNLGFQDKINIDFSIISYDSYYSGIVFKGYISGISTRVLSGGRYDKLMQKMGRSAGGIGFAVYLDTLERMDDKSDNDCKDIINIALPKGRLGEKVYSMFEKAGFECPSIKDPGRKLIFENNNLGLRFFWVKPSDVSIYVERGAADIGVAGKDILLEYQPDVYELLDLNIGKCKMAVAAKKDFMDDTSKTLRVATKFSNIANSFYSEKCRDIDIIHLNGSIELAPILGLSDVIVDIVETGKTLFENNLEPVETIAPISARLISNKSSLKFKSQKINNIRKELLKLVEKIND